MQYVSLALLLLFAACGLLSFFMRVRMGMLERAIESGSQPESRKAEVARYYGLACRFAIAAAVSLVLCVAAGALRTAL